MSSSRRAGETTVAIVGGTGNVGLVLAKRIAASSAKYRVILASREPDAPKTQQALEQVRAAAAAAAATRAREDKHGDGDDGDEGEEAAARAAGAVSALPSQDACYAAELIINATPGMHHIRQFDAFARDIIGMRTLLDRAKHRVLLDAANTFVTEPHLHVADRSASHVEHLREMCIDVAAAGAHASASRSAAKPRMAFVRCFNSIHLTWMASPVAADGHAVSMLFACDEDEEDTIGRTAALVADVGFRPRWAGGLAQQARNLDALAECIVFMMMKCGYGTGVAFDIAERADDR